MSAFISVLTLFTIILFAEGYKRLSAPGIGAQLPQIIFGEDSDKIRPTFFDKHIRASARLLPQHFNALRGLIEPELIEKKLEYAGQPYRMTVEEFFGFQLFMMIIGFFIGAAYMLFGVVVGGCGWPLVLIVTPIAGFFYPRFWLDKKVQQRQEAISLSMPDLLDMLAISVQAGMGFDNALRLVVGNTRGPLSEELRRCLRELEIGEPRAETFRRLVERNTSEDLHLFVDALLQAEELGTPIARTLQVQAEELRIRRVNRAKELASKASPKISLVTVFLIAPSALLLFMTALMLSVFAGDTFQLTFGQ